MKFKNSSCNRIERKYSVTKCAVCGEVAVVCGGVVMQCRGNVL